MDLIKDYNANLRQQHAYLHGTIEVKNLIVHADDYASVFEHVIQNFIFKDVVKGEYEILTLLSRLLPKRTLNEDIICWPFEHPPNFISRSGKTSLTMV